MTATVILWNPAKNSGFAVCTSGNGTTEEKFFLDGRVLGANKGDDLSGHRIDVAKIAPAFPGQPCRRIVGGHDLDNPEAEANRRQEVAGQLMRASAAEHGRPTPKSYRRAQQVLTTGQVKWLTTRKETQGTGLNVP